jgi:uncharacterized protein (TIGR02246 family)
MRNLIVSILLAVFVALVAIAPVSANTADGDRAAAGACRDLVMDYAWYWDHNNHEDFANLFTADADFQAAGRVHKGRDDIFAAQSKRTGNVVTRMFFTNVRTTPAADGAVDATSYLMVHSEAKPVSEEAAGQGTIPTRGFRIIGEMDFSCSETDEGWKIASVKLTPVFNDENLEG